MAKIVTDKQICKFTGVSDQTLINWKRPRILPNGTKFYPPTGRHNLYKGARIATYLLDYPTYKDEDGEEVSEMNNRLEILVESADELNKLLWLACGDSPYYDILKNLSDNIKGIADDLEKLSNLS